jgi:hypothetical protein
MQDQINLSKKNRVTLFDTVPCQFCEPSSIPSVNHISYLIANENNENRYTHYIGKSLQLGFAYCNL